ncbi:hypothetical protein H257_13626 [Aphanomyces astaci]|uniref:1-phosphatidylinositol 4-kinase n=2 Tax=Aphanomyces astaci TaxID=112090 RepID=W4FV68_APHAT|nr:hypothetical protein H257_13626 [Aphanomyces astaci]ETV70846.1 hypothetical protein H257_13626 [Aphanomyces astaci]|eukprot:XP_009839509.1 hypothetical protein H257_13626 [Aphanomyces astaci]
MEVVAADTETTPLPPFPVAPVDVPPPVPRSPTKSFVDGIPHDSSFGPTSTRPLVHDGVIDMRLLMISIWKHRKNVAFTNSLCDELSKLTNTRPILDQVDFYLPQLSHMVLHLEKELPMEAMEQFVMLLSLSSSHFALQFFWIVYGALDEHRPKKNGNPRTFTRCAQLLVILEQCFIYGSPVNKQAKELFASHQISKAEMGLILKADRRFFAAQSSACMSLVEESFEGWLYKKGGGTSKLGRRSWHRRWCCIERKILFIYNNRHDRHARNTIPLERAEVRVIANPKRHHYFEIHHSFSNTTFKFAALTAQDLQEWVDKVDVASAPPGPPPSSPSKVGPSRAIERMSDRMRSFILEPERRNSDDDDDDAVILTEPSPAAAAADGGASLADNKNADSGKEHEVSKAAPVVDPPSTEQHNDIFVAEKVAGGIGTPQDNSSIRNARTSSGSAPVHLTSDEQMRYDFFTAQISFVKAITDICEDLRLVDVSKRKELLPTKLTRLHETLPKYAYLPLCRSTDHFYHVAAVCAQEGYVFKTHERAPVLMHFLTTPNSANMDVSCALFAHLHAQDEHIDTVKCNAPVLNESTPFIDELLMDDDRRTKLAAIFGELKCQKSARLAHAHHPHGDGVHLQSFIAKSYDDLRQEVLVMQLISYLDDVFKREHLKLKLHPYRILSTGASTGLIELVANATSFDGLKKSPGFKSLRNHFESIYGATNSTMFHTASSNFVQSLAAYSIVCYILCIKDRHNGNILLDVEGHVVHIDFGFFLGRAPGGSFSFETAPFKLTMEMVECMGGKDSANFKTFTDLCIQAAVAARRHGETLYTLVEVMSFHSKLPCFSGNVTATLQAFRDRLFLNVPEDKVGRVVEGLIHKAFDNFGTAKYDQFQEYSNGIAK